MHEVMGDFPHNIEDTAGRMPPRMRVKSTHHTDNVVIRSIEYAAEEEDWVPAYILQPEIPENPEKPGDATEFVYKGAILALHQTTRCGKAEPSGLDGDRELAYGIELARRGYVVLVPDYPGFGDYMVDPYALGYHSTTLKAVYNHIRGINLLSTINTSKESGIGVIGHSLGGHNALFLAAFDSRVSVVVTSCGFTSFSAYKGGDLSAWAQDKYMPRISERYDCDPARMPFDFPDVLKAIAPRRVLVSAPVFDTNFDSAGVVSCISETRRYLNELGAKNTVQAMYPKAKHSFPAICRRKAYEYIDALIRPIR